VGPAFLIRAKDRAPVLLARLATGSTVGARVGAFRSADQERSSDRPCVTPVSERQTHRQRSSRPAIRPPPRPPETTLAHMSGRRFRCRLCVDATLKLAPPNESGAVVARSHHHVARSTRAIARRTLVRSLAGASRRSWALTLRARRAPCRCNRPRRHPRDSKDPPRRGCGWPDSRGQLCRC
jgi:hypothetical protein